MIHTFLVSLIIVAIAAASYIPTTTPNARSTSPDAVDVLAAPAALLHDPEVACSPIFRSCILVGCCAGLVCDPTPLGPVRRALFPLFIYLDVDTGFVGVRPV